MSGFYAPFDKLNKQNKEFPFFKETRLYKAPCTFALTFQISFFYEMELDPYFFWEFFALYYLVADSENFTYRLHMTFTKIPLFFIRITSSRTENQVFYRHRGSCKIPFPEHFLSFLPLPGLKLGLIPSTARSYAPHISLDSFENFISF